MQITQDQVKKIAELVKIPLTQAEIEKLAVMFSDTLQTIEILQELDTTQIAETYQVTGLTNVFQEGDDSMATLSKEEALKNAKKVIRGLIATEAVFDRG